MKRSARQRAIYALSILFALAPFAFGLIRATEARDPRLLWMAVAAFLGAALIRMFAKDRSRKPNAILALSAVTLVVAAVLAASVAYLLGATAVAGIWPVAFVLGLCLAASYALYARSRGR
jgi:hypothetical protein